jgi:hypothetical protein
MAACRNGIAPGDLRPPLCHLCGAAGVERVGGASRRKAGALC